MTKNFCDICGKPAAPSPYGQIQMPEFMCTFYARSVRPHDPDLCAEHWVKAAESILAAAKQKLTQEGQQ